MPLQLPDKASHALLWITGILNGKKIPFQVSGGFAAKLYGSPRSLNDIDMDIPKERFTEIVEDVRPYITFGPAHHKSERWDLYLMTLNYHGQEIDIGSAGFKVYDDTTNRWLDFACDYEKSVWIEVAGISLPVAPKEDLIAYKRYLAGDHQKIDIEALS